MEYAYLSFIRPIIIAIAIIFWFRGSYRIVDYFINDSMNNNIALVVTALSIFYLICGNFVILGNVTQIIEDNGDKNNKMK